MKLILGLSVCYCVSCIVGAEIFAAPRQSQLFKVIPLGETALLVRWEPFISVPYLFVFSYQEFVNGTLGDKVCTWQIADNNVTQAKIYNLKRGAKYRVIIENEKSENLDEYFVESETGGISTSPPFKPDFEYSTSIINGFSLAVCIIWLPCGKQHVCRPAKARAGSHFYVKYRIKGEPLYSRVIEEKQQDKIIVTGFDLRPSKIYEFCVVSVDGDFETESDMREVFFFAATGPVRSLKATPLGSSSFFITWATPRDTMSSITEYNIIYTKNLTNPFHDDLYTDKLKNYEPNVTEIKISGLEKNTAYRIYVVPRTEFAVGIENFVEAITLSSCTTRPFKPSFRLFLIQNKQFLPSLKVQWFPCGRNGDCGTEKPGASFYVRYKYTVKLKCFCFVNGVKCWNRYKEETTYNVLSETEDDCIHIHDCLPNKTYEFVIVSVSDNFERESDAQEIKIPNSKPGEELIETIAGENFTLKCKSSSTSSKIRWFRNDNEISNKGRKYTKLENGDLLIKNSYWKNSGVFKCYDENLTLVSPIRTIFFSVKEPTRIINLEPVYEVERGQNFSLSCSVEKDRTLSVAVSWLKNDRLVENNVERKSALVSDYFFLNIFDATADDSANYTCSALTRLDAVFATVSVKVKAQE